MGEEVLVLGGEHCVANDGGDFVISRDPSGFRCHLLKRLAVGIVNGSDRGELKAGESIQIGQIVSIKVDMIETRGGANCHKSRCAGEKADHAAAPTKPPQPGSAYPANRRPDAHPHAPEPGATWHRLAP